MESRAHHKQTYALDGKVSLMATDYALCSEDFTATFRPRPAIRARAGAQAHHRPNRPNSANGVNGTNGANGVKATGKPHVAVVGAGLAGLRCAQVLLEKGFKVTIFEARDHVGGRIWQVPFNGTIIDVGASWIHGTENNPIAELAATSGVEMCTIPEKTLVYGPTGSVVPQDKVDAGLDKVWELVSDAFRESNQRGDEIDPRTSLKDYFVERLNDQPAQERDLILLLAEQWGGFIGDEWHKQSLRWFWMEECLDGDNLFVSNTYAGILNRLHNPLTANPDCTIHLSTPVASITTSPASCSDPLVTIATSTSAAPFTFDEVVCAIPLGCLKKPTVSFDPPLLPSITKGIQDVSYSSFEKIFIAFPSAWWDGPEGTAEAGEGLGLIHYLTPEYMPKGQPAYSMEVMTLSSAKVFGKYTQPTVFIQTYGAPAAHVISLLRPHAPLSPEYLAVLSDFFKPYFALLPHYDESNPACAPTAGISTAWLDDPLGGHGSYTNFKTSDTKEGEVLLDKGIQAIRKGEPERGLWFAGEHVAPFLGLGTTTGAYWSGECTAMTIAAAHGMAGANEGIANSNGGAK